MVKSILLAKSFAKRIGRFTKDISDRDKEAKKASVILKVILDAQSPGFRIYLKLCLET